MEMKREKQFKFNGNLVCRDTYYKALYSIQAFGVFEETCDVCGKFEKLQQLMNIEHNGKLVCKVCIDCFDRYDNDQLRKMFEVKPSQIKVFKKVKLSAVIEIADEEFAALENLLDYADQSRDGNTVAGYQADFEQKLWNLVLEYKKIKQEEGM